jgi:hypothetical protein
MKLYILAVIIIILISCSCFNYKEGLENNSGQTQLRSSQEGGHMIEQNKYFKSRKYPNVAEGPAETGGVRIPTYKDKGDGSKLIQDNPGAHVGQSEQDKNIEKCKIINDTRNCKFLKGTNCGYCHSNKTFMYGDQNGPKANKCPKKDGENAWVGPKDPRGVAWVCQKFKDQETCSKVKNCGGSTGEAAICGWCPAAQKGFVVKQDTKGGWYPKYKDDVCDFKAKLKSGKKHLVQVNWNNRRKVLRSGRKLYLYNQGEKKGEFTPTKIRSYSWGIYAYVGWRVMVYFSKSGGNKLGVWTGKNYTNHVMDKSNWISGGEGRWKWAPTGWELKTEDDILFDTSLIHVNDCAQFKQLYPCMGPNWRTGPHTQACIQKKWEEGGCDGEVDDKVRKSGLNLHDVKKVWNSNSHGAMLSNVKTFRTNTSSSDFEKAKTYTKACMGTDVPNCSNRWNKRPKACDTDMWKWSGCGTTGKMNPNSNEPWAIELANPYQTHKKEKNKDGSHSWGKVWNKVWRTRWLSDHHTRNPKQDYGKTIKYTLACRGKVPPPPWKKPCWKDFSDMCRYCYGVSLPSADVLNFKNGPSQFRDKNLTELKRTDNKVDSNQFPRMLGDWNITKTTYKLPDFPYWNFTNRIIPALKKNGGNTGISWGRNFIREMTKVPGIIYVGHLKPPTPNRMTKSGMDELWFSEHLPFYRMIKAYKLPTTRYKGVTYTRLYQSRYKGKQGEYGFEYGFPYWAFFQAAASN